MSLRWLQTTSADAVYGGFLNKKPKPTATGVIWKHDSQVYKPSSTSLQECEKFHYKSQWVEHGLWKCHRGVPSLSQGLPQFPKDPAPSLGDFHWFSWIILLFSSPLSLSWLIVLSQHRVQPMKGHQKVPVGKAGSSYTNFTTSRL